jgi:hypothetical protein
MANIWYPKFKEAMLMHAVGVNLADGPTDIRVILVDLADYAYSAAHVMLSDVPAAARVSVTAALTGRSISDTGLFDADDSVFPAATGDVCEAMIVYLHTGTEATSRLMLYLDTSPGLPMTPTGVDLTLTWSASGIAQL